MLVEGIVGLGVSTKRAPSGLNQRLFGRECLKAHTSRSERWGQDKMHRDPRFGTLSTIVLWFIVCRVLHWRHCSAVGLRLTGPLCHTLLYSVMLPSWPQFELQVAELSVKIDCLSATDAANFQTLFKSSPQNVSTSSVWVNRKPNLTSNYR